MFLHRRRALRPVFDILDDRCLLSGLTPQQVRHIYGLDAVTFSANGQAVSGNGSGQTIAVVVAYHDAYIGNDLRTFDRAYGLPDPALAVVNLAGNSIDSGWAGEETLDVEWAHAIAPGAAIVVVEARSDSFNDMLSAINVARNLPGVSVVSMSWGMSEFRGDTAYDSYFTTPKGHTGITFVASSGDDGAWAGAQWPAASPNVVGVGGTSLYVGAGDTYGAERTWAYSGGGISRYESEPSYQRGVQSTGRRSSPDVAFDADPSSGVWTYTTDPATGRGSWGVYGGTSLGAPAWAGIMVIVDQGRATVGLSSLNGASQTLPALYSLPSSDFHKVGNVTTTGLGTPNGAALVYHLAYTVPNAANASTVTRSVATATKSRRVVKKADGVEHSLASAILDVNPSAAIAPHQSVSHTAGPAVVAQQVAAPVPQRPAQSIDALDVALGDWAKALS